MPRTMTARFDVTGLSEQEIGQLAMEVTIQAEESDHVGFEDKRWEGHRGVPEPVISFDNTPADAKRVVVIVHGLSAGVSDESLRNQIEGALDVGVNSDDTPDLASTRVHIETTVEETL
jgi:hypothetical protein